MENETKAKELLGQLWTKREKEGELDEYDRGVFETLQWLFEGASAPELE